MWLCCFGDHFNKSTTITFLAATEGFFFIAMIIKSLTDYKIEGEKFPVRDLFLIVKNYLNNGFMLDFIAILPI